MQLRYIYHLLTRRGTGTLLNVEMAARLSHSSPTSGRLVKTGWEISVKWVGKLLSPGSGVHPLSSFIRGTRSN